MSAVEQKHQASTVDAALCASYRDSVTRLLNEAGWYRTLVPHHRCSFWDDVARGVTTLHLFPNTTSGLQIQVHDDEASIGSDWQMVAADIYTALLRYAEAEAEKAHGATRKPESFTKT